MPCYTMQYVIDTYGPNWSNILAIRNGPHDNLPVCENNCVDLCVYCREQDNTIPRGGIEGIIICTDTNYAGATNQNGYTDCPNYVQYSNTPIIQDEFATFPYINSNNEQAFTTQWAITAAGICGVNPDQISQYKLDTCNAYEHPELFTLSGAGISDVNGTYYKLNYTDYNNQFVYVNTNSQYFILYGSETDPSKVLWRITPNFDDVIDIYTAPAGNISSCATWSLGVWGTQNSAGPPPTCTPI